MIKSDAGKIIAILKLNYPQYYKDFGKEELNSVMELWADLFAEDDVNIVLAAVKALLVSDNKGFPPVIGQVKEKIRLITQPSEMGEIEAWAIVRKAIGRSSRYRDLCDPKQRVGAEIEFENLPQDLQNVIHSPSVLLDWQEVDSGVAQSHFMRAYRAYIERKKEFEMLPEDIKKIIKAPEIKLIKNIN